MRTLRVIIAIVHLMCFLHCSKAVVQVPETCNVGWFGLKCQYKCRCIFDKCETSGNCITGSNCTIGWFGPACQYYNMIKLGNVSSSLATDDYETTCNNYQNLRSMSVTWKKAMPFTWLRLGVDSPGLLNGFNLILENSGEVTCGNVTQSVIDPLTLDIHCSQSVIVKKLTLTGEGFNKMCYIYISGGRNVAIKQRSSQSSTYIDSYFLRTDTSSDKAVDGDIRSNMDKYKSCTHTQRNHKPLWRLNFTSPKLVNRYVLYNRDKNKDLLKGFLLESFAANGSSVFSYTDQHRSAQNSYTIIETHANQHIQEINISLKMISFLTLCEVEAYGDSVCPSGYYGRDCEDPCKCQDKSETCYVSTGSCPSGCEAGFHGEGCQKG